MLKSVLFILLLFFCFSKLAAQDLLHARKVVDTLTSEMFWGRGYTNNGMAKAAKYIANEFHRFGLHPLKNGFFQELSYPVNTFPGTVDVHINGSKLIPGKDFIISPESKSVKAKCELFRSDSTHFINREYKIIVSLEEKLTWLPAGKQEDYTAVQILKSSLHNLPKTIDLNVSASLNSHFKASNIYGYVPGTAKPDSFIVFSGHYDHLGGMGDKTYFPGANDNASGIALVLGLAKHFSEHPQKYSILFICFAGEEAGLLGSKFYTEHPEIPLDSIKFLINTDMVGTGDEGITVVNGSVYSKEFNLLKEINSKGNFLSKINSRGKAANSDHYWFTEKGVPGFFIYTMGGIKAYHDIFDRSSTLPLNEYDDLFKLLVEFSCRLSN